VLCVDEEKWGLKPLRILICWDSFLGYRLFVEEKWRSFNVDGWGGYVLKEKLKLIKVALKEWHQHHSQNLSAKIVTLKDKITYFDLKGETSTLLDGEVEELHELTEELFSMSMVHNSICWQQSRAQWLREGDANSKKFHGIMTGRRRGNAVSSVVVNGVSVEGVDNVRNAVFSHFSSHFKAQRVGRPSMEAL